MYADSNWCQVIIKKNSTLNVSHFTGLEFTCKWLRTVYIYGPIFENEEISFDDKTNKKEMVSDPKGRIWLRGPLLIFDNCFIFFIDGPSWHFSICHSSKVSPLLLWTFYLFLDLYKKSKYRKSDHSPTVVTVRRTDFEVICRTSRTHCLKPC